LSTKIITQGDGPDDDLMNSAEVGQTGACLQGGRLPEGTHNAVDIT